MPNEITAQQAAQIAMQARGFRPNDVPSDRWEPFDVTDSPPTEWYRTENDVPSWYVWFLQPQLGVGASEIIVVCRKSGAVLWRGLAPGE
jgi:hypothetical protein